MLLAGDSLMAQTYPPLSGAANRQTGAPAFVMAAEGGSGLFELEYYLQRFETLERESDPDAVVLSFGTNSARRPEVVATYLERAAALLDQLGPVPVLWVAPRTDLGPGAVEIGHQLRRLAAERDDLDVRGMDELLVGHPERSADDGIHLSWAGEEGFARVILAWLTEHGFGEGDHPLDDQ